MLNGDWLTGSASAAAFEFSAPELRFCFVLRQAGASASNSTAATATDSFNFFKPSFLIRQSAIAS
jgi:hypothetical protein